MELGSILATVAAVSLIATVTVLLSGEDGGVKLLAGLCVTAVLLVPVGKIWEAFCDFEVPSPDLDGTTAADTAREKMQETLEAYGTLYLAELTAARLSETYGKSAEDFSVRFTFDGGEVTRVTVVLSGGGIFLNTYELEDTVSGWFGCPCDTAVG